MLTKAAHVVGFHQKGIGACGNCFGNHGLIGDRRNHQKYGATCRGEIVCFTASKDSDAVHARQHHVDQRRVVTVAAQLLEVEKAYFSYVNHVETLEEGKEIDPSYQEAFETAVKAMTNKFGSLTTEEQAEFNSLLESVYGYYVGEYDKLNESDSAQA